MYVGMKLQAYENAGNFLTEYLLALQELCSMELS